MPHEIVRSFDLSRPSIQGEEMKNKNVVNINNINITPAQPPKYLARFIRVSRNQSVIAWDIETDTRPAKFVYPNKTESDHPAGLDPRVASVISIAATNGLDTFAVDAPVHGVSVPTPRSPLKAEAAMVGAFEKWLEILETHSRWGSVLVGWNTTYFDVPFLKVRGFSNFSVRKSYGEDEIPPPKYGYPEWRELVYGDQPWDEALIAKSEVWDISHMFKGYAEKHDVKFSLKPVAQSLGIDMLEIDFENGQQVSPAEMREYNLSDVHGTWKLAQMIPELFDAGEL
jgi:hypothetical protein